MMVVGLDPAQLRHACKLLTRNGCVACKLCHVSEVCGASKLGYRSPPRISSQSQNLVEIDWQPQARHLMKAAESRGEFARSIVPV